MKALLLAAALSITGSVAQAITVTYSSGTLIPTTGACFSELEGDCFDSAKTFRPRFAALSYEITMEIDDTVEFVDDIAIFEEQANTLLVRSLRLFDETKGRSIIEDVTDRTLFRDVILTLDRAFEILDFRLITELTSYVKSPLSGKIYMDHLEKDYSEDSGPLIATWLQIGKGESDLYARTIYRPGDFTPVPLPASAPLLITALAAAAFLRRRKSSDKPRRELSR